MEISRQNKTITISQNTGITFSVAFLLLMAGGLVSGAVWVDSTQNSINTLVSKQTDDRADINQLETDVSDSKIKYAEIQTQLKSIDATLLEIKQAVK